MTFTLNYLLLNTFQIRHSALESNNHQIAFSCTNKQINHFSSQVLIFLYMITLYLFIYLYYYLLDLFESNIESLSFAIFSSLLYLLQLTSSSATQVLNKRIPQQACQLGSSPPTHIIMSCPRKLISPVFNVKLNKRLFNQNASILQSNTKQSQTNTQTQTNFSMCSRIAYCFHVFHVDSQQYLLVWQKIYYSIMYRNKVVIISEVLCLFYQNINNIQLDHMGARS
ncbi:hypothetical protein ABPG74_001219 [Tetrahymena malaccensis]